MSFLTKKSKMFKGRNVLIATMHGKEKVIAPIIEKALGVHCVLAKNINTDHLGTFSGEIERKDDPVTTMRSKCVLAQQNNDYDIVIASEGSFGPHPNLFFIPANEEFMMLKDFKNNVEIVESHISTHTNFRGAYISSVEELEDFIEKAKFPEHGLIIRKSKEDFKSMYKGIHQYKSLIKIFDTYHKKYGRAYIETDMRAHFNPTRMLVIEELTEKLIQKVQSVCPNCQFPGFGKTEAQRGLLCSHCHQPTDSIISYKYQCQHCHYEQTEMYPFQKHYEDPMYCNYCNP